MNIGDVFGFVVNNVETVTTVGGLLFAGGGAYLVKARIGYQKAKGAFKELDDVYNKHREANKDGVITKEEFDAIMNEVGEAVYASKDALEYIWGLIPRKLRSKLPKSFTE